MCSKVHACRVALILSSSLRFYQGKPIKPKAALTKLRC